MLVLFSCCRNRLVHCRTGEVQTALEQAGIAVRCQIIWAKKTLLGVSDDISFSMSPSFIAMSVGKRTTGMATNPVDLMAREQAGGESGTPDGEAGGVGRARVDQQQSER